MLKIVNICFSIYIYLFYEINIFKDCDVRKYGKVCLESCGVCFYFIICNYIIGDCEFGCELGW